MGKSSGNQASIHITPVAVKNMRNGCSIQWIGVIRIVIPMEKIENKDMIREVEVKVKDSERNTVEVWSLGQRTKSQRGVKSSRGEFLWSGNIGIVIVIRKTRNKGEIGANTEDFENKAVEMWNLGSERTASVKKVFASRVRARQATRLSFSFILFSY